MKLLSGRQGNDPFQLFAGVGDRFIPLHAVSRELADISRDSSDVGALLQAGDGMFSHVAEQIAAFEPTDATPTFSLEELDVRAPIATPSKIICVGLNYAMHAEEGGQEPPSEPLLFVKTQNTVAGHRGTVRYPEGLTRELDYEGELAVVVGRSASWVAREDALTHVAGYTIYNDITARDLQLSTSQWYRGKSLDGSGPYGPIFVSSDELPDPSSLTVETSVNGELRQSASCGEMIFDTARLISFISAGITLCPGDIIATGTPAGVGHSLDPPRFLEVGDVVEVSISGIGTLRTFVGG